MIGPLSLPRSSNAPGPTTLRPPRFFEQPWRHSRRPCCPCRSHAVASRYGRMTRSTRSMRAYDSRRSILRPSRATHRRSASSATSAPIRLRNLKQSARCSAKERQCPSFGRISCGWSLDSHVCTCGDLQTILSKPWPPAQIGCPRGPANVASVRACQSRSPRPMSEMEHGPRTYASATDPSSCSGVRISLATGDDRRATSRFSSTPIPGRSGTTMYPPSRCRGCLRISLLGG